MLRYIRWTVTVLVVPPLLVFLGALSQAQIEKIIADRQIAVFGTRWLLTISESTHHLVGTQWFWFVFGFLSGAVATLWMVEWSSKLRRREWTQNH